MNVHVLVFSDLSVEIIISERRHQDVINKLSGVLHSAVVNSLNRAESVAIAMVNCLKGGVL